MTRTRAYPLRRRLGSAKWQGKIRAVAGVRAPQGLNLVPARRTGEGVSYLKLACMQDTPAATVGLAVKNEC
jgi:hypothetical protein